MLLPRCTQRKVRRTSPDKQGLHPTKKTPNSLSPPRSSKKGTPAEDCKGNSTTSGDAPASSFLDTDDDRKRSDFVPLSVLILRGNSLTDAGALLLCPLVEASATLKEVDLRDNLISDTAQGALKKVVGGG